MPISVSTSTQVAQRSVGATIWSPSASNPGLAHHWCRSASGAHLACSPGSGRRDGPRWRCANTRCSADDADDAHTCGHPGWRCHWTPRAVAGATDPPARGTGQAPVSDCRRCGRAFLRGMRRLDRTADDSERRHLTLVGLAHGRVVCDCPDDRGCGHLGEAGPTLAISASPFRIWFRQEVTAGGYSDNAWPVGRSTGELAGQRSRASTHLSCGLRLARSGWP